MIMHIFFLVFSMPRRGSILDSRSDRSRSFQTSYRLNNKGSMFHHPVYHNSKKYYISTLGSTHPPQHDYGRVDAYQYCEGFRFQDLFLTQGGFSRDNQLAYEGHNSYRSYERVDDDDDDTYDGDIDNDANIKDEDEGNSNNERGVCDEDQDSIPSNNGSTSSPYNYDRRVKRKGFDTPMNPIIRIQLKKKKSFVCME